jgi:hypothetical protein
MPRFRLRIGVLHGTSCLDCCRLLFAVLIRPHATARPWITGRRGDARAHRRSVAPARHLLGADPAPRRRRRPAGLHTGRTSTAAGQLNGSTVALPDSRFRLGTLGAEGVVARCMQSLAGMPPTVLSAGASRLAFRAAQAPARTSPRCPAIATQPPPVTPHGRSFGARLDVRVARGEDLGCLVEHGAGARSAPWCLRSGVPPAKG